MATISKDAILASVRYNHFPNATFVDDTGTWVRAMAVYQSKKRFYMSHPYSEFLEAARSMNSRLDYHTDEQGDVWLRALPRRNNRRD